MMSFWKHKKLRNSVLMTYLFIFIVLFEFIPELNQNMQIVYLTQQVISFYFNIF